MKTLQLSWAVIPNSECYHDYMDNIRVRLCFSLRSVRAQVFRYRLTSPLFNNRLYTKNLERLFLKMWERHSRGLRPDHIQLD